MDFSSKLFLKQNLYRWFKKQETKEHRLTYLFLELSRKCNLNCLHCGSDCKNDSNFPELTRESWKKIISYVKNEFSSKVNLVITGGEPLMHPDLIAIGKHIKSQKMNWGMVTNGILLSQNYLSQLEDTGISSITISLDGIGESHNYLRQSGKAFEKTKQAIEQIGKSSITFKDVVTCVYPENIKQLDDIAALLINLGITSWRLFRIFPSGRAKLNTRVQLSYEQTWEMISWIKKNKKTYKRKGLNIELSCEGWIPFGEDISVRNFPFFCRSGINFASILADGTITGCSNNHPGFAQGNVLKDDFRWVWKNRFEDLRSRKWIEETNCKKCQYFKECNGGSIHLWEKGNPEPAFCYMKK